MCQNFEISMYLKKFPFALQTIFSLHNLEADNLFQPTTACEQFFYKKGDPPDEKIMVRPLGNCQRQMELTINKFIETA